MISPNRKTARSNSGFSLIEVMVAIAILGIILVAVSGLMVGNLQLRRASNRSTDGQQLAASYLESIKRTWSVLDNYLGKIEKDGTVTYSEHILPDSPVDPRTSSYTIVVDIKCLNLDGTRFDCVSGKGQNPELREVLVTVKDPSGLITGSLMTQIGRPFEPARSR